MFFPRWLAKPGDLQPPGWHKTTLLESKFEEACGDRQHNEDEILASF
jgi:hypothetical protein